MRHALLLPPPPLRSSHIQAETRMTRSLRASCKTCTFACFLLLLLYRCPHLCLSLSHLTSCCCCSHNHTAVRINKVKQKLTDRAGQGQGQGCVEDVLFPIRIHPHFHAVASSLLSRSLSLSLYPTASVYCGHLHTTHFSVPHTHTHRRTHCEELGNCNCKVFRPLCHSPLTLSTDPWPIIVLERWRKGGEGLRRVG